LGDERRFSYAPPVSGPELRSARMGATLGRSINAAEVVFLLFFLFRFFWNSGFTVFFWFFLFFSFYSFFLQF
jgi:hypothetical protein